MLVKDIVADLLLNAKDQLFEALIPALQVTIGPVCSSGRTESGAVCLYIKHRLILQFV